MGAELREKLMELDGELWDYQLDKIVPFIQQEIANQLKALLDAHMIKPEYHNLVVGKWKELNNEKPTAND